MELAIHQDEGTPTSTVEVVVSDSGPGVGPELVTEVFTHGFTTKAAEAGARFARMSPRFLANLDAELTKRNFRPQDRARLVASLRKAGVPLPMSVSIAPVVLLRT